MKKVFFYLLVTIVLSGCSASLQSGGWIIPVGLVALGGYCFLRFQFGLFDPLAKGSRFAKICAIVLPVVGILIYVAMVMAK